MTSIPMPSPSGSAHGPGRAAPSPAWMAPLFALGVLSLGMLSARWGLSLVGHAPDAAAQTVSPEIPLPTWIFWAVWVVNYPCLGIATWVVWRRRHEAPVTEALVLFGVNLLVLLAFMPITSIAGDNRVAALMDVLGLTSGYAVAWSYARVSRTALQWLTPYLVWLPITTALKLWLASR